MSVKNNQINNENRSIPHVVNMIYHRKYFKMCLKNSFQHVRTSYSNVQGAISILHVLSTIFMNRQTELALHHTIDACGHFFSAFQYIGCSFKREFEPSLIKISTDLSVRLSLNFV